MIFYTNVQSYGGKILYRGVENGNRVCKKFNYKPSLFFPTQEPTEWTDIHGHYFHKQEFDSIRNAKEFMETYKGVSDFPIHGIRRFEYAFIRDYLKNSTWNIDYIKIFRIDIEVKSDDGFPEPSRADKEVTAITIKSGEKFYIWGTGKFTPTKDNQTYFQFDNERSLMEHFLGFWVTNCPDIVTGWNIKFFDIPYLYNRLKKLFGEKKAMKLSPWGVVHDKYADFGNRKVLTYTLWGIATLDSIDLYQRYSPKGQSQDSYALDNIAQVELNKTKLRYEGTLDELRKNDYQKYVEYNIEDVILDHEIEAKYKLIFLALTLAYDNKVNIEDVFSQVRMWTVITDNYLYNEKKVINHDFENTKDFYTGGYVKEPQIGMHEWVVSYDLNSLYPHLIMQYNIGPETLVDASDYNENLIKLTSQNATPEKLLARKIDTSLAKIENVTLAANNQVFKRDRQSFMSKLMETMYNDRTRYKKEMIECKKKLEVIKAEIEKRKNSK